MPKERHAVKIWYDVSDLVGWNLPHLTGIQRASLGILNGLVEHGSPVWLVRYDVKAGRFFPMAEAELPLAVRCHLRGCVTAKPEEPSVPVDVPAAPPAPTPPPRVRRRRLKLFRKDFLYGSPGEAEEMRHAYRQFKTAARQFGKCVGRWAGRRLKQQVPQSTAATVPTQMRKVAVRIDASASATSFAAPGDVLLSVGATWCMAGHSEAVATLRGVGVKVVRMIYDLIPTIRPQWLEPHFTRPVTTWVRDVLQGSDQVLTISGFSRREIERYCDECRFDVPPLTVVRLGDVMGDATAGSSLPPLPRFTPVRPFFVCVSTLDVRKNHRLLYDVWTQLATRRGDDCPDLVCIGLPHLHVADLLHDMRHDRMVNRHIHVLHGIEDCELDWYYKNCQATIYPSKYEGWGLPVAESLGHGRMCLASNATSIPEISRDLPEFFDPYDVHALVALVERVLDAPEWVREREATIRETFQPTRWRETAAQVLDAIRASAGRGGQSGSPRLSQGNGVHGSAVSPRNRSLEVA